MGKAVIRTVGENSKVREVRLLMEQWKIDELKSALDSQDTLKIYTIVDKISFFELMELCKNTFVGWIKNKFKITKKHSLFKNDFFGIKQKLFVWKNIKRLKQINHLEAKQLEYLLNMTLDIGYPRNEEQEKTLQWVCDKYDALFEEINGQMNRVKRMLGKD